MPQALHLSDVNMRPDVTPTASDLSHPLAHLVLMHLLYWYAAAAH